MRLSADKDDKDFIGSENAGRYKVFVDGQEIRSVVEADDVGDCVWVHVFDKNGPVLNKTRDAILRREIRGNVVIVDTWAKT